MVPPKTRMSGGQKTLPVSIASRGAPFGRKLREADDRIDMIIDDTIIVEHKTVERLLPIHEAQLLTCLEMKNSKLGFLLNWNVPRMKDGIKGMVNNL
jgi:GxxExxY protein